MSDEALLDQPLDQLEISVKAFAELSKLGVLTLGDLVSIPSQRLRELLPEEQFRSVLQEIFAQGFYPVGDPVTLLDDDQEVPDTTWGAVFVYDENPDALLHLIALLCALYAEMGASLAPEDPDWKSSLLPLGDAPSLAGYDFPEMDDLFVLPQEAPGWYAVMSSQMEWTRPGVNPLAESLALHCPDVVALTSVAGQYSEITRYEHGMASQSVVRGTSMPAGAMAPDRLLDVGWFVARDALGDAVDLYEAFSDLDTFGSLTGCESQGFRMTLEEDDEDAKFLQFR